MTMQQDIETDTDDTVMDVLKIEANYPYLPDCYVSNFEDMQVTLEYMLGEPDCWCDAATDFKVTITIVQMTETEFAALENWEDLI